MKEAFILAGYATVLFIDVSMIGGLILAFIDYVKEKRYRNGDT